MTIHFRPFSIFTIVAAVALAVMLGLPTAASAAAPEVSTISVAPTGDSTARFLGQVNPENETTTYQFEYDLQSSAWCTSGGTSGSTANSTSPSDVEGTNPTAHNVGGDFSGLTLDVEYCGQVIATNADGQSDGGLMTWWQSRPDVDTFDAFATGFSTATVEGDVNPEHLPTTYQVLYAPVGSDWCTSAGASGSPFATNPANLGFSDDTFHDVSVDLTGLSTGTAYCAELFAYNGRRANGSQVTWTESIPDALTFDAFSTGASTVTVEGVVNPGGQATTYEVQYDVADSDWCMSDGVSGSPAHTSGSTSVGFTDTDYHFVSVDLSGLTDGGNYCGQLVASNVGGEADGGQVTWTQGAPTADTFDAFSTEDTTATVEGDVNPADQGTTYVVKYDLADSEWCTSAGTSGTPGRMTVPQNLPSPDGAFHDVSIDLAGLTPDTAYCGEIVAANGTGSTPTDDGDQAAWTQLSAPTHTLDVTELGTGAGTITSSPAGIDCRINTCSQAFTEGTKVILTATAGSGSTFEGWSGGGCSGTGTCVVTLNSDINVAASFARATRLSPPPPPATKCIVPKVSGEMLASAKRAIKSHHCSVGKITRIKSTRKNKGHVISETPKPGKHLRKGSKVALKVGK